MKTNKVISIGALILGTLALARPINPDPNNPNGPNAPIQPMPVLSGSVLVANCNASTSDVIVRLSNGRSAQPNSRQLLADGRIRLGYRFAFPLETSSVNLSVSAAMRQGVCSGGSWSPQRAQVNRVPSTAPLLNYAGPVGHVYRIKGVDLARSLDTTLTSMKMKMNNYQSQSSFIELLGFSLPFQVQRTVVDIDCGTFCPDLGNGYFYLNDINLKSSDVTFEQNYLKFKFNFEDAGREIKGIHSALGDNGMPDFQMDQLALSVKAFPRLTPQSKLALSFYGSDLDANIQSTGGCNIGGIDLCNKIFGTDRKIQKGVEGAATTALNSSVVQSAVSLGVQRYLDSIGATAQLLSVQVVGGDIVIATK